MSIAFFLFLNTLILQTELLGCETFHTFNKVSHRSAPYHIVVVTETCMLLIEHAIKLIWCTLLVTQNGDVLSLRLVSRIFLKDTSGSNRGTPTGWDLTTRRPICSPCYIILLPCYADNTSMDSNTATLYWSFLQKSQLHICNYSYCILHWSNACQVSAITEMQCAEAHFCW